MPHKRKAKLDKETGYTVQDSAEENSYENYIQSKEVKDLMFKVRKLTIRVIWQRLATRVFYQCLPHAVTCVHALVTFSTLIRNS